MRTRKLDPVEVRVLGALMEKEQTTPASYPLTINGVIAASNQKSNRNPVTNLSETEVVEALDRLREDVLTWRTDGARVERWQHSLDRRWSLTPATKALMCLLMVRGPQTVGELKTRSERMVHFDSLQEVEEALRRLADDFDALVVELPRRPGQRETRWQHILLADEYAAEVEAEVAAPAVVKPTPKPPEPTGPTALERLEKLEGQVESLQEELLALRRRLGDLE